MNNFSSYFSKEQYKNIISYQTLDEKSYEAAVKELTHSFKTYLHDLNQENKLSLISNREGHHTNFDYFWTSFISNNVGNSTGQLSQSNIDYHLETFITKIALYSKKHNPHILEEELLNQNYQYFTDKVTQGNFSHFECGEDYCFECGEKFNLQFENWTPTFLQSEWIENPNPPQDTQFGDFFKKKLIYVVAPTCENEKAVVLPVEFKTGNLLISDWFRIPEFTSLVDDHYENDINSAKGRINLAKRHLEKFNLISAPSSGSPYVFKKKNRLVFALNDDNEQDNDAEKKAFINHYNVVKHRVNSGLRNITVIEKEQLIYLITQSGKTEKEATSIVEHYIQKNSFEIIRLNVSPGIYNIKFSGDCYDLKNHLQDEESFPHSITPFLIMENKELTLKKKIKHK